MKLKKFGIFFVTFIIVYFGFQMGSGLLLTSFYVSENPWNDVQHLTTQVSIQSPSLNVISIVTFVLALLIAYGVMKFFARRFDS